MRSPGKLKAFGILKGTDQLVELDEISLLANSDTFKFLGRFLRNSAKEMKTSKAEHIHLQDRMQTFSHKKHADIILVKKQTRRPRKTKST